MINEPNIIEDYLAKQQISACDQYNLGMEYKKIVIQDRFGRVAQFPLQSFRCSDKFVAKDIAYVINRKHYFGIKINNQMKQNLSLVYNEAVCYQRQCIIRQFNLFQFNKKGNIMIFQKGEKRIRKFKVPYLQQMRFGTNQTCTLDFYNQIIIYDLTLGKPIKKLVFDPPYEDDLFEVSNNLRFLYLRGQLFELRNQRDLRVTEGLKIAQFTKCSNYFYSINRYQIFEIWNMQEQQIIQKIKLDNQAQNPDFMLLDMERKILIMEFWISKTRSCVKLDFNKE